MDREYLRRFVPGGGSAIKFVMADDEQLLNIREKLEADARENGLHVAAIDAAATKIHMIHDVFFAISRSVDWERLAQTWIEEAFRRNRYAWPRPGESAPLREVAAANEVDEILLRREMQKWLAREIMREKRLAQDFRSAIANLCLRRMELGDERATAPVVEWLRGDLRTIGPVRQVPINGKITRHNGRVMLRSLCHWLRIQHAAARQELRGTLPLAKPRSLREYPRNSLCSCDHKRLCWCSDQQSTRPREGPGVSRGQRAGSP